MNMYGMSSIDSLIQRSQQTLSTITSMTENLKASGVGGYNSQIRTLTPENIFNLSTQIPLSSSQDLMSGKLPYDYFAKVINGVQPDDSPASSSAASSSSTANSTASSMLSSFSGLDLSSLLSKLLDSDTLAEITDELNSDDASTEATNDTETTASAQTTGCPHNNNNCQNADDNNAVTTDNTDATTTTNDTAKKPITKKGLKTMIKDIKHAYKADKKAAK